MVSKALLQARIALETLTPLKKDCGALCGQACCQADPAEPASGMLLFPTEESLYWGKPWANLVDSAWTFEGKPVPLLVCQGACPRQERPLACRLFPLAPHVENAKVRVVRDPRAWPVCPLMPHGKAGLSPAFMQAVGEAFALLWEDPQQQDYLRALSDLLALYRLLPD